MDTSGLLVHQVPHVRGHSCEGSLSPSGDRLLKAANEAAVKAAAAAEVTRQRMQQSAEDAQADANSPREEAKMSGAAVQTPPSKTGRKIRYPMAVPLEGSTHAHVRKRSASSSMHL